MAHVADPILIKPADQTDRILRIAESMPGATYETRVVKRLLNKTDWLALHQGQEIPPLYRLEATNLTLDGFYEKISKNRDGTDKHVGSIGESGSLFEYDSYRHGEDKDETEAPEDWVKAVAGPSGLTMDAYDKAKDTRDAVLKQVSNRPAYQPLQSGVWVDVAENEDDIKELHPDPADAIVNLPGSDDKDKRDLAMIKTSEKLDGILDSLREFILEAVADAATDKL